MTQAETQKVDRGRMRKQLRSCLTWPRRFIVRRLILPFRPTWVLERELKKLDERYKSLLSKVKEPAEREEPGEREELGRSWAHDSAEITDVIEEIKTSRLIKRARSLDLSVPSRPRGGWSDEEGNWEFSQDTGTWYLGQEAYLKLRSQVRHEFKERRELWLPWLLAVSGVLGTATGFIAICCS